MLSRDAFITAPELSVYNHSRPHPISKSHLPLASKTQPGQDDMHTPMQFPCCCGSRFMCTWATRKGYPTWVGMAKTPQNGQVDVTGCVLTCKYSIFSFELLVINDT